MAGVTFVDSTGLRALLRAHVALGALGRSLLVAEPRHATTRVFQLAGVHDTLQLAVEPS